MSEYTINDLIGKYVKFGTPECEVFLDACEKCGLKWVSGRAPKSGKLHHEIISIYDGKIGGSDLLWHHKKGYKQFILKTQWSPETNTLHTIRLSGEQFARLYEAEISGGERFAVEGENAVKVSNHTWFPDAVYQVKSKSEFKLFEERAVKIFGIDTPTDVLKQAFEEGCRFVDIKAPEVEK